MGARGADRRGPRWGGSHSGTLGVLPDPVCEMGDSGDLGGSSVWTGTMKAGINRVVVESAAVLVVEGDPITRVGRDEVADVPVDVRGAERSGRTATLTPSKSARTHTMVGIGTQNRRKPWSARIAQMYGDNHLPALLLKRD
jgi:hypothetical protein